MNRPAVNILDRPLGGRGSRSNSPESSVSLSAFAYLYSELVQYHQNRVDSISELERRLESSGYGVGLKVLELLAYRSRESKREIRLMTILQFISTNVWKALFHKPADALERSLDHADEFMIIDYEPITSTFASVPPDYAGHLSVDAYLSGIISGILQGAGFSARVTAHSVPWGNDGSGTGDGSGDGSGSNDGPSSTSVQQYHSAMPHIPRRDKAVFLVKFTGEVLSRDAAMDK